VLCVVLLCVVAVVGESARAEKRQTSSQCNTLAPWNNNYTPVSGTSSWFDAVSQGGGACGYTPNTSDRYVAAYSAPTNAEMCAQCGTCFNVTGPTGSAVVRIIDYCDTSAGQCGPNFFTLDQVPYTVIAGSTGTGSVPITYYPVPCPYNQNLEYSYGPGGNQKWYVAIRVDWERYPLSSVEIMTNGTEGGWYNLPRQTDNVWSYNPAPFPQVVPANVRVNDTAGQSIVDTLPDFSFSSYVGTAQFAYTQSSTSGTGTSGTANNSGSPASTLVLPASIATLFLCIAFFFLLL